MPYKITYHQLWQPCFLSIFNTVYSLTSLLSSKVSLLFAPLLLLSYSLNMHALSAAIKNAIEGSPLYLMFDKCRNKTTAMKNFLGIRLSNGTKITSLSNKSTPIHPIVLSNTKGEHFADIGWMVTNK
ncbi:MULTISPECIES: hypothetical protein [unclassified Gilliamella]|uniref:hypothetical protein n=1 Tax=unclassified Gilliamella TaxID=2685620 RepID=UPI00080EB26E|nr:hypothetical protein [Gilliamella apicola]OCG21250.1 hypothetical protein A9G23_05150 [Gilliamella apicola]OCG24891.1 hypothetical protein A9G22_03405 [Gilliamella apicola]